MAGQIDTGASKMTAMPSASIIIPTRSRPDYLRVTLASVVPQAEALDAEIIVADDGGDEATASLAELHGARLVRSAGTGANAARNAGIEASTAELVVLTDDDVRAPAGWLQAVLGGVKRWPEDEVFGGPIQARLEGGGPRACGREPAPITTLDYGPEDRDVSLVWSANMAIRRRALERVGEFDETIHGRGEEEDWQRRHVALGGRIRYLAGAGLEHRRTLADSRLWPLTRSAFALGRTARRYDIRKGTAASPAAEAITVVACLGHAARRGCAIGIVLAGHAAGRLVQALAATRS